MRLPLTEMYTSQCFSTELTIHYQLNPVGVNTILRRGKIEVVGGKIYPLLMLNSSPTLW